MRAKEYPLLKRTIEAAIDRAWALAHKGDTEPSDDEVLRHLKDAVLADLQSTFVVQDGPDGA